MRINLDDEKAMRRFIDIYESGDPLRDFYSDWDLADTLAEAINRRLEKLPKEYSE